MFKKGARKFSHKAENTYVHTCIINLKMFEKKHGENYL